MIFDFHANTSIDGASYKVALLGVRNGTYRLDTTEVNDRIVIHFSPTGLSAFCKTPMDELNNTIVNAEDVWGKDILWLYDALQSTQAPEARIKLLEAYLWNRRAYGAADSTVAHLAKLLQQNPALSMQDVKRWSPVCLRQLQRRFKQQTGLSISRYKVMARFSRAMALLKEEWPDSFTDIALKAGYYDQAHFNSDVKTLAGSTPRRLVFC